MENPIAELSERATAHNRERNYGAALGAIDQAIEMAGLTPALDLLRAESFVGLEMYRDAYDVTRNLLERGGESVRARSLLYKARILRRSSSWLDDALEASLEAAQAARRQGDLARAIAGEAHLEAARCFARKSCRALAERELDAAGALLDSAPLLNYYRGAVLMDFDDRPAARAAYQALLDAGESGRYLGTVGIAYLEYVMGEFEDAHRRLDHLAPFAAGDLWPRRIRAQLYEAEQRWDDAADAFDDLRRASPESDHVWRDGYERAHCLYRAGRLDDAREACEELLQHAPERDYWAGRAARMARLLAHPEAQHRPKKRLREFPSVTQLRDHCGPASCELYLRYFGLTDSQVEIARAIKRPDGGTPVYKMRRYLDEAGFETRRIEAELPVIRRLIDAGIPVIMEESYSSSSHVAVAIGYDDALEIIEVQDPMTHKVRETHYEDLAELRNLSNHGALIAAPASDPNLVAALDRAGGGECRYIALVDEAWAALDDDRADEGDRLADESIELHRDYEYAWMYRFRRARHIAQDDPSPDKRVEVHRILGEINALWPDDEWPQQLRGQALFFDDRTSEALIAFERARDRDPGDPYNWSMIADCHLELGNQDAAYDALVEALSRDPSYVRPNENLADLCLRRGRTLLAWALNDAARELNPENPYNHGVHGQLLEADGDFEGALAAFDRGLELDPDRDWLLSMKSKLLARMDRVDDAVTALQALIDRRPEHNGYQVDLADLYYEKDRVEDAVALCDQMLEDDRENASAHAIRGAALGKLERYDEAIDAFDRALARRPTYVWVYKELGHMYMRQHKTRDAIQAFAAALGMSSGNAWRELDLGEALVKAGYTDEGVRHLRAAGLYGNLDEAKLAYIGELMVDAHGGRYADDFFHEVGQRRQNDIAVLRAHARTLLEVCWAPGAAREVLEAIQGVAADDTYALVSRAEDLFYRSIEAESSAEELIRAALAREPSMGYGRRILADALVDRGRFEEALELLEPCGRSYQNDKLRVKALLGIDDFDGAAAVIEAFRAKYGDGEGVCVGAVMLEYLVARRHWDWRKALELAEMVSREMNERDDDGKLDRWEEERFECMARLGENQRALRFGEAQATEGSSLGRLAYLAYHADQMELAGELAARALRLDPDESQALAVVARNHELGGDIETAIDTWQRIGDVDEGWHAWQEQIARVAVSAGDVDAALERSDEAVAMGHLCPWSFAIRAQASLLAGDREAARVDLERSWMLAAPEVRENEAHDVWAMRAALSGDADEAERRFAMYLAAAVTPVSQADRERVERIREAL